MSISLSYASFVKDYHGGKMTEEEYVDMRLTMAMERGEYIDYTDKNGVEKRLAHIDHHPVLKEYEVWCEGYAATGESGGAQLFGKCMARNWMQACDIVMCSLRLEEIKKNTDPETKGWFDARSWCYDPGLLSYWGCRLYPREDWARLSFG